MTYIKGSPSHFTDDMVDSVTVYKSASKDAYGKHTFSGTGTTYACRIMSETTRTKDTEGKQVVEGGKLIILNEPDIAINDRLVLDVGNEPLVLGVDKVTYKANGSGTQVHHTVIRFGRS